MGIIIIKVDVLNDYHFVRVFGWGFRSNEIVNVLVFLNSNSVSCLLTGMFRF